MKKYIRSERANLFEPNVYISLVIRIKGTISKEDVQHAVEEAYKANEATMSKIVLEENGDAYYQEMSSTGCKFLTDNLPWMDLLNRSEKETFALNEGELVRIFLTEEEDLKVLLIHAHHLACDGKSILILLDDILNSLDGKLLAYKPMISVNRRFLEKRASLPCGIQLFIKKVNRKWQKIGKNFTWDDYYAIHKKYWEEYSSEIDWITYSVKEITKQCPKEMTVNSYMITELIREYPRYNVVGIPVSIREKDGGMSNQTSGIAVKCRYNPKRDFAVNLGTVHKSIYRRLKNKNMKYFILLFMERLSPSLIDGVLLQSYGCYQNVLSEKLSHVMGYMGDGGRDLGVTNLNKINIPAAHDKFVIADILFVPPKVSYAKNIVGISTYEDTLTVCFHKMRKNCDGERNPLLFQKNQKRKGDAG